MKDLMIDLETLGTSSKAVVISIGACFFDPDAGKIGETFYAPLQIKEQITKGREVNADTLYWWMCQPEAAKRVFNEDPYSVENALVYLNSWIGSICSTTEVRPWGNGSIFDISIMESLFADYGRQCPWRYSNVMDLRTFRRFVANNMKVPVIGTAHNAVDDAVSQAQYVIDHMKKVTP